MSEKKTIPTISIEAQEIVKLLLTAEIGQIITYAELNAVCLGDVQNGKRGALYTACKRVFHDENRVFQTVRDVGVKRANDEDIINEAGVGIAQVHRQLGRKLKKLNAVNDYDALPKQKQIEYNARVSQIGALYLITKPSKSKQIEGKVAEANQKLALKETMQLFGK